MSTRRTCINAESRIMSTVNLSQKLLLLNMLSMFKRSCDLNRP